MRLPPVAMIAGRTCLLVCGLSAALVAQRPAYTAPHALRGSLPGLAPPTAIGGGEVLIEAGVDRNGALTHPVLLRTTPPFSQMVLDAVMTWRVTPAHALDAQGRDVTVESSILIAAVYRPPALLNGPTTGTPPRDLGNASANAPYPVSMVPPLYPAQAVGGSVVLFEVALDEIGRIQNAAVVGADPGFIGVARDALMQWQFRGAHAEGRPVPSTAFVIFGFSSPIISLGR